MFERFKDKWKSVYELLSTPTFIKDQYDQKVAILYKFYHNKFNRICVTFYGKL